MIKYILFFFVVIACSKYRVENYVIPKNYTGRIVVIFNVDSAPKVPLRNDTLFFKIGNSGILRVKDSFEQNFVNFESEDGNIIPHIRDVENIDSAAIIVFKTFVVSNDEYWIFVGPLSQSDSIYRFYNL
jgi:hypothetical protein